MLYKYFFIYDNILNINNTIHKNSPWGLNYKGFENKTNLFLLTFFILLFLTALNYQIEQKHKKVKIFLYIILMIISIMFFLFASEDYLYMHKSLWNKVFQQLPLKNIKKIYKYSHETQEKFNELNNIIKNYAEENNLQITKYKDEIDQKYIDLQRQQLSDSTSLKIRQKQLEDNFDNFQVDINKSDNLYDIYQISIKTLESSTQNNTSFIDSNRNSISQNAKKIQFLENYQQEINQLKNDFEQLKNQIKDLTNNLK